MFFFLFHKFFIIHFYIPFIITTFASLMSRLDAYSIDLMGPNLQGKTFDWDLDDSFFEAVDGLVRRGSIHTNVECESAGSIYRFRICSEGVVIVPCDRCLSDLELRIETSDELLVKLGSDYCDEGDCVIVPETDGCINLAQFIYEFIALSMPITLSHEPGKCDEAMIHELSKYQAARSSQEDEVSDGSAATDDSVDERWAALKNLNFNN